MRTRTKRAGVALGVATLGLTAAVATPAEAGSIGNVTIAGTAVCGQAMGVPEYTLNWTFTNNEAIFSANIQSATESGAFTGTVDFTPTSVAAGATATGSDGPVPGDTTGTVTLTVVFGMSEGTLTRTGTIQLEGCELPPSSTTSSSSSSTSSSSTSTIRTTTTVRAAAVSPRFTG